MTARERHPDAVANVDARHGYTCEFSANPDAHRREYDEESDRLWARDEMPEPADFERLAPHVFGQPERP